jgi:hypothetical protein
LHLDPFLYLFDNYIWYLRTVNSEQIGDNAEAYVNDVVVKTKNPDMLLEDLKQTSKNLNKWK